MCYIRNHDAKLGNRNKKCFKNLTKQTFNNWLVIFMFLIIVVHLLVHIFLHFRNEVHRLISIRYQLWAVDNWPLITHHSTFFSSNWLFTLCCKSGGKDNEIKCNLFIQIVALKYMPHPSRERATYLPTDPPSIGGLDICIIFKREGAFRPFIKHVAKLPITVIYNVYQ